MDKEEIRMSYSSMSEIRSCEMKYAHRKIFFSEVDPDVEDSDLALRVGGCFHEVLENCNHKYPRATLDEILPIFDKYEIVEGARPDTIAEEIYGSSELDWVVIITAGIINVRDEWPLSNAELYNYALDNKIINHEEIQKSVEEKFFSTCLLEFSEKYL